MTRRRMLTTLALTAATLVVAACGEESTSSGTTAATRKPDAQASQATAAAASQAELDGVVAAFVSDLELLDDAYPDDSTDDDLAVIIDTFEDALAGADGVEDVERVSPWKITEPLPCGASTEPDHAVIAQGVVNDFFIGRASRGWIAGFAETSDGDLGAMVARCEDGSSLELHLTGQPGTGEDRVAAASFDESSRELLDQLPEQTRRDPESSDLVLSPTWSPDDSIECVTGDTPRSVRSDEDAKTPIWGLAGEDVVAIVTTGSDDEISELLANCVDGTADDFRQTAKPLHEALEDAARVE